MGLYSIALKIFQPTVKKYGSYFSQLKPKLRVGKIRISFEKYVASIFFIGLLVFATIFLLFTFFGALFLGITALALVVYFFVALFIGLGSSIFIYLYPSFVISERSAKIDHSLPFISIYLATISKSGFPPQHMFKMLSKFKDFKDLSNEARLVSNDIYGLGLDLPSALNRAMKRSPSASWTELLAGIRNSITVGGDVSKYLEEKSDGFVQDYKRRLKEFSKVLTLFMNMYITIIIVGTVFFVVVSSLMATVGGVSVVAIKSMQYGIVFLGLPLITAAFILMIRSASPWSD